MAYIGINTNAGNSGLTVVQFNCKNKPYHFLIDTGSKNSYIDIDVIKKDFVEHTILPGQHNQIVGEDKLKVAVTFYANMFSFDHEYVVADLSSEIKALFENCEIQGILGTDFLKKYNCHLDYKKNRLHIT
jgi:retroviral aspartyl protease